MKIEIKSKQIYEDYEDVILETHDAEIVYIDNGFKLVYDDAVLYFDGECVYLKRENMSLEIRVGVKYSSEIVTPYGEILLEVEGEDIDFVKSPFEFDIRYLIKVGNTKAYVNELQICDCSVND